MKPTRTLLGGLAGGAAFIVVLFLTFAQLGGSGQGETGLLFDPATQSAKLIAIWKDVEPLPMLTDQPLPILTAYFGFAVAYAFAYRSVAAAWRPGVPGRTGRLAALIWLTAAFFELQGPVNLAHQPLVPLAIALAFWALAALAEALVIVLIVDRAGVRAAVAR